MISLPAQIASIYALKEEAYYLKRYKETHKLRNSLRDEHNKIGIDEIIPGVANFIMFHINNDKFSASAIVKECKKEKLYLRDVTGMGRSFNDNAIRMAVKDKNTNNKMIKVLRECLEKYN